MLIHVATDNDIHPPRFGATQRTFGLCRGLARRHDVRALCVVPNRNRAAALETQSGVTLIRRRAWYTSLAWRLDRWGVAPMAVAARGHRASAASLIAALPGEAAVFTADLLLTPLFERHPAPVRIYTAHNVEADHFGDTHPSLGASPRWRAEIASLERRAAESAARIVACTGEDAARFTELYRVPRERILVAPNGWDETRLQPVTPESRARARAARGFGERETVVLFVGSNVPHNRAAAGQLIDRVMPELSGEGFRLVVVGSVTRALGAREARWLTLVDELDDLAPWLHAADVGVNPVTAGGGSNVKLPAYLAAGLAVVTTPFGLRGYPDLAPFVHVAGEPDLAAALRERPLGWAARGLAMPAPVAALSWGRIGERLATQLEPLVPAESVPAAGGRPA